MLKKRSIATMMAAATVATSVAPVFAAETEADVVKRVEDASAILKKGEEETDQLIKDLRFLLNEGAKFEVVESSKHKGTYTTNGTTKEVKKDESAYAVFMKTKNDQVGKEVKSIVEVENAINSLKSKGGNIDSLELAILDKGHALVNGKISAVNGRGEDIDQEELNSITIVAEDVNTTVLKVEDLYDGEYLTQKGFELYSAIRTTSNLLNSEIIDTITLKSAYDKDGNKIVTPAEDQEYGIKVEEGTNKKEQTMKFELHVNYLDSAKEDEIHYVTIIGTDLANTAELADFLNQTKNEDIDYTLGASRLAGEDRFKTAIKIAKEYTKEDGKIVNPTNIVLVNAESMIDGLTATPLAAALEAPVLLTNKDAVQVDTLDYIKEVKKANGNQDTNVTIVGGDGVVSEAVVRELEKLGLKVDRVGGKDRHATSVEVGIKIKNILAINDDPSDDTIDKAFIVAATGEADAMSIAPVAAREIAPIIVEGFDGMSTTSKELLKDAKKDGIVDLIGGKVTEETQELYAKSGDHIKGADRYDTNAKVVEKYCKNANAIYVAKDGMANSAQLVDALAVGTLADKEGAAIILATDGLSTRQKEAVKSVKKDGKVTEVKQIGGGVNFSNTVKSVAKILGFTK